ncbi:hypothetical protein M0804_006610 [Polistes exclamans]|nr:hypothetical protein M0804_006610 [Polistes exclamans]
MADDLNARNVHWGDCITKINRNLLKIWEDNNGIQYRAVIHPPDLTTFPSANSFPDLCITDNRLLICNLNNESNYSSNHKAILVDIIPINKVYASDPSSNHRFMFKKTKWLDFTNKLKNNYNNPAQCQLCYTEIDQYIKEIDNTILQAIRESVPKYRPTQQILQNSQSIQHPSHTLAPQISYRQNQ